MESVGAAEMAWLATTSVCGTEKVCAFFAVTAVTACGAGGVIHRDIDDRGDNKRDVRP